MVSEVQLGGNSGDREGGVIEQHFDFSHQLLIYQLFGRFAVEILCGGFVEVTWSDAEPGGIERHKMLLGAVFAHQLHEAVAQLLFAVVLDAGRSLFVGNGVEEPHQQTLQEVVFVLRLKSRLVFGEKHTGHIHPQKHLAPGLLAALVGCVPVAGVLVRIIKIRCINGQDSF